MKIEMYGFLVLESLLTDTHRKAYLENIDKTLARHV